MKRAIAVCLLLGLMAAPVAAQTPKYGVTVKADDTADFTKFRSYVWEAGWESFDKTVHKQIVAAVDRELAGLGFEKKTSGPADVLLTYATVQRTDADLKAKPTREGELPQHAVGSLVVLVLEPGTRKEFFRARGDQPIETEPAKLQAVIDAMVTEMFAKYPTRTRK
jgi:hypothetical protein